MISHTPGLVNKAYELPERSAKTCRWQQYNASAHDGLVYLPGTRAGIKPLPAGGMNCPAAELRGIKMNFYLFNPDAEHRGIPLIKRKPSYPADETPYSKAGFRSIIFSICSHRTGGWKYPAFSFRAATGARGPRLTILGFKANWQIK
jgi:hypothetical protein